MQIVIDISEETYEHAKDLAKGAFAEGYEVIYAIAHGTPLPKGHGRLIDADKLLNSDISAIRKDGKVYVELSSLQSLIEGMSTIIEAEQKDTCDTCDTPCVMYEKGMKGCGKENK